MASTITLQSVVDFTRTHVRMAPIVNVGGIANEPALSLCNDVLQSLLSSPYAWRFNKNAIPSFTTIPYQQDYLLSGCQMSITNSAGGQVAIVHLNMQYSPNGAGLTQSGTTATANFSDFAPNGTFGLNGPPGSTPVTTGTSIPQVGNLVTITGAVQAGYNVTNATVTGVTKSANGGITGVQFTAAAGLIPDGGQGINGISWMEHATLQDYFSTGTVRPVHDIEVVASLPMESIIQPPFKVAFQVENILPQVVSTALADSNGQSYWLGINAVGQATTTQITGGAQPYIILEDSSIAQAWKLTVNTLGQLVTTATSGSVSQTQILLQSSTGTVWALEVVNGILTTTVFANNIATQVMMRFWPIPSSQIWNAFLFYQAKAPTLLSLNQTWNPWPDDMAYILRSGLKAAALNYFEDPRYPTAEVKWQQDILKGLDVKDQEARHEAFFPDLPLLRGG